MTWPKISLTQFAIEYSMFGATSKVRNSNTNKWVYSGYGIVVDEKGE